MVRGELYDIEISIGYTYIPEIYSYL
jgi:hypothetical protein